jgi:hypothetical protein
METKKRSIDIARTTDNKHPEDAIYEVVVFIRKLNTLINLEFSRLYNSLNMNDDGIKTLEHYINKCQSTVADNNEFEDFSHYLEIINKDYSELINK